MHPQGKQAVLLSVRIEQIELLFEVLGVVVACAAEDGRHSGCLLNLCSLALIFARASPQMLLGIFKDEPFDLSRVQDMVDILTLIILFLAFCGGVCMADCLRTGVYRSYVSQSTWIELIIIQGGLGGKEGVGDREEGMRSDKRCLREGRKGLVLIKFRLERVWNYPQML